VVRTERIVISGEDQQNRYLLALIDDVTDRRQSEHKIEQLAHYDTLTGLANRNLFKDRIEESLSRLQRLRTEFAVLMVDLDKFKTVNDTLGHQAGDTLLKQVSDRIKGVIREVDIPARLGGDEFALIVLPGEGSLHDGGRTLAARLIDALRAPYEIDGQEAVVGCSIGIAVAPAHGETIDELLRNADLALYKSKDAGGNCFHFYSHEFKAAADKRNALESDLRRAIWREEFEIYYQPVVSTQTERIIAVEALVRWHHPTRGFLGPGEFIGLAEETGLVVPLGEWVLAKACVDAKQMPEEIKIAVNLSPVQFSKSNVLDVVTKALAASQLPAGRLEIEITENVLLKETSQNSETLHDLKNLGVSIALDDFGVGYSSLSYLTSFPFDKVKIDRTFVEKLDRPESRAVIGSIQQLSRTLNLRTCVEGVETESQFRAVVNFGVDLCQGYFFGVPAPLAEIDFGRVRARYASKVA
jgi:diguanylate cyclase (GGDEF)-like protein